MSSQSWFGNGAIAAPQDGVRSRERVRSEDFKGLRRIEWVILRLKTPQSWGLQGAFAFLRDLKFGTTDGWHEHRNVHGGFGIRIRFLVFDRNRQCAESLVIRKHA